MNSASPWPPIIAFARASNWMRLRDILLTTTAWTRLIYLMRDGLRLILDYFSYPIFQLTHPHSADWLEVWNRMSTFLILSVVAMLWLLLWGLIHRRRLQFSAHVTPPAELPLDQHAAFFQLDPAAVEHSHQLKITIVQFDAEGRIGLPAESKK
jgi:poly-beta-1,6-N-acetyl-D-glucosamine biosynthesis protein PgaD